MDFLANETMRRVIHHFNTNTNHRPSQEMYEALGDVATTLSSMADGTAERKIFLCSLDPGVGKTTVINANVDSLLTFPDYEDVGVIVCVARLDEIRTLTDGMAIPEDNLAILTSDRELNSLGKVPTNQAQVLFTTQQMIEKRLNGSSFESAEAFFYRGKARAVRIWDESWLPGIGVTVTSDDLSSLLKGIRPIYPDLASTLDRIINEVRGLEDGGKIEIPDFEGEHGIDLSQLLGIYDGDVKSQASEQGVLTSLWPMSGRTASIKSDRIRGNTVLTYKQTIPEDISPMVVLDASGRVRETYLEMKKHRGNITLLKPAVKRYNNLNIHVWKTGGGKASWADPHKFNELIEGITSTITTKPDKEWLIVCHKPSFKIRNVEGTIRSLLDDTIDQSKLHFIQWGRHMATNEYADVSNIVLAGTLFFRPSYYEAIGRLAADREATEEYSAADQKRIALGEHRHGILQALCRASVRQCRGENCAPCDAYIVASVNTGIPDALPSIFPGANVSNWRPVKRVLRGKVAETINFIDEQLSMGKDSIKFTDIKKAIGVKDAGSFHAIRRHEDFISEMAERGVVEWGNTRKTSFYRINGDCFDCGDETAAA